jgi:hypothetical protein
MESVIAQFPKRRGATASFLFFIGEIKYVNKKLFAN